MTDRLRALVAQWRKQGDSRLQSARGIYRQCADELDAALRAEPTPETTATESPLDIAWRVFDDWRTTMRDGQFSHSEGVRFGQMLTGAFQAAPPAVHDGPEETT